MNNAPFKCQFSPRLTAPLTVESLFDAKPGKGDTSTSCPNYASRWFSPVGRSFFAELNYRFGANN